jgi:hypothetical protein
LESLEERLKATIGRFESLDGRLKAICESLEGWLKATIGRFEILEGGLKAAICESLEERLKASIVIFNHHWRAKEVGSKALSHVL